MTMTAPNQLLSLDEAGHYMGVHARTVRRWISKGLLPGHRVGPRFVKVSKTDLDALLQQIPVAES